WYVEFAKPLFDGDQAEETRATMRWVIDQCLILLHPIMPFITEELWGLTGPRPKMCVHADWPTYGLDIADADADREMSWVLNLIESVRSSRAQMRVPVGLKLPMLALDQDAAAQAAYAANAALIERLARLDGLHPADSLPKGALTVAVEGATYALPLGDVIDIAAETDRLSKSLEKLQKEIGGLQGRLGNPRFVANADPEVVDETRAQLAEKSDEAARLAEVIAKLEAMA
ncbi:MAG: class I tRNA ligase family protein, partial [Rhodobacteraceae bacterium]|nr:class I tRNA ligase family protein [Paracoccaceae bacterium]